MLKINKSKTIKERDLYNKIYIICYEKPIWTEEIAKIIWGENYEKSKTTLSKQKGPMKQLIRDQNLIEKLRPIEVTTNQRYYLSTPKYIIDQIRDITDIKKTDLKRLYDILNSNEFRSIIKYDELLCNSITSILNIISFFSLQIDFVEETSLKYPRKQTISIDKSINNALKNITNIFPHLNEKETNQSTKNAIKLIREFIKIPKKTRIKLSQINPNFLLNYIAMAGAFTFGLDTRLKNR